MSDRVGNPFRPRLADWSGSPYKTLYLLSDFGQNLIDRSTRFVVSERQKESNAKITSPDGNEVEEPMKERLVETCLL